MKRTKEETLRAIDQAMEGSSMEMFAALHIAKEYIEQNHFETLAGPDTKKI